METRTKRKRMKKKRKILNHQPKLSLKQALGKHQSVWQVVKVATIPLVQWEVKISLQQRHSKREKQNRLSKSLKRRKKRRSLHPKEDFKEKHRLFRESLAKEKNQQIKMMSLRKMTMVVISLILHNLHKRSQILLLNLHLIKSKLKRKNQKKNLKMEVRKVKNLKLLARNSHKREEASHSQIMNRMAK